MSFTQPSQPLRELQTQPLTTQVAGTASEPTAQSGSPLPLQYRSRHLLVSLHEKPATLAPILIQPASQPQLIVQLAGSTRLCVVRRGIPAYYQARPGSVHLDTAQQVPYELAWQSPTAEPIRSVHISLAPDLLRQTALVAGFDADRLELLVGTCLDAPLLQQLGYSLAAALQALTPADSLYLDTMAQMLAAQLVHRHSTRPASFPIGRASLSAARLQQLREYVQASLHQPITLESLAAIACLSTYHFSRAFKQATGLSPQQYVISQRLDRARQLLRRGRHSVGQVARAVGYQSASHFTRLYQRHLGVLPSEIVPRREADSLFHLPPFTASKASSGDFRNS